MPSAGLRATAASPFGMVVNEIVVGGYGFEPQTLSV
jgi:hypothetical protein